MSRLPSVNGYNVVTDALRKRFHLGKIPVGFTISRSMEASSEKENLFLVQGETSGRRRALHRGGSTKIQMYSLLTQWGDVNN